MSQENFFETNTNDTQKEDNVENTPCDEATEKSEFERELENYLPTPQNTDKIKSKKINIPQWVYSIAASALTCIIILTVYSVAVVPKLRPSAVISYTESSNVSSSENSEQKSTQSVVSDINNRLSPSMVGIETKSSYRNFFGISSSTNVGSGIILTKDGYILTSCSLVGDEGETSVILQGNKRCDANLVGQDVNKDIAILKVDATDLPAVTLGNSDNVNAGDTALVIGNTLGSGLGTSVTKGIICGINNGVSLKNGGTINLFQTDAITGSGSAGGCLLNSNGDVIGMITNAIVAENENISFAIPSNDIQNAVQSLINTGVAPETLIIGITGSDTDHGVSVESVMEGTPAENSGIEIGDLILKVDDTPVKSVADINKIRDSHKKGDKLIITLYRNGEMLDVNVIL